MVIDHAKGIYFWDVDGKRYLDLNSAADVRRHRLRRRARDRGRSRSSSSEPALIPPTVATTKSRAELGLAAAVDYADAQRQSLLHQW